MKRLFEDPETLPELREDLQRSMAAGRRYDASSQLPQVLDAMAKAGSATAAGAASGLGSIPGVAKLAAAVAVAVGGIALVAVAVGGSDDPGPGEDSGEAARRSNAGTVEALPSSGAAESGRPPAGEAARGPRLAGPSSSGARREIALVVRIRRLLPKDPAAAYQLALRAEREFPDGVLAEEREALLIQALAALGKKEEAASRAKAFHEQHATSPLRAAVEQSTEE